MAKRSRSTMLTLTPEENAVEVVEVAVEASEAVPLDEEVVVSEVDAAAVVATETVEAEEAVVVAVEAPVATTATVKATLPVNALMALVKIEVASTDVSKCNVETLMTTPPQKLKNEIVVAKPFFASY